MSGSQFPTDGVEPLERTPLLGSPKQAKGKPAAQSTISIDGETLVIDVQEVFSNDVSQTKSKWNIFLNSLLGLFGLSVLVIFIKGFIDSDDVEVKH